MGEVVGHPLFGRELSGGFGFEIQHWATSRRFPGSFAETKVPVRFFSLVQKKSVISNFFAPLMNKDDFLFGLPERFLSSSETSEKVKTKSFEEKEIGQKVPKNISYPELEFGSWHPGTKELEVERVWAQARRPGPKFWLLVNKPQARGSASLIFQKARSRLELELKHSY